MALLAIACSNDEPDPQPTTTTLAPATTATTATTSTTSPTTLSSTTTSSTTTVPTSVPLASVEEFRTFDMRERLADTHVHFGGSVVHRDPTIAVGWWGQRGDGAVETAEDWFATGGTMEIWVEEFLYRTDSGSPVWRRADVLSVDVGSDVEFSSACRLGATPTDGLLALVPTGQHPDEPWVTAASAWQIDLEILEVHSIDAAAVECENSRYGI